MTNLNLASENDNPRIDAVAYHPETPSGAYGIALCYWQPDQAAPPEVRLRVVCQPATDLPPVTLEAGTAAHPVCVSIDKTAGCRQTVCRPEAYQLAETGEALIAVGDTITLHWPAGTQCPVCGDADCQLDPAECVFAGKDSNIGNY